MSVESSAPVKVLGPCCRHVTVNPSCGVSLGTSGVFVCTASVITSIGPSNVFFAFGSSVGEQSRRSCSSPKVLF